MLCTISEVKNNTNVVNLLGDSTHLFNKFQGGRLIVIMCGIERRSDIVIILSHSTIFKTINPVLQEHSPRHLPLTDLLSEYSASLSL